MKREEIYIPYKERTPKELCRDINIKAEKSFLKKDKFGLLFFIVFFLGFVALHFYYKTNVAMWFCVVVEGAILTGGFFIFKTYLPKGDKSRLLIWVVALLVCLALAWNDKMYVNWGLGAIFVGAIVVVTSIFFKINQKLINEMNLASTPKQFLPVAKRLKKCVQIRNIIVISLLFWLPALTINEFLGQRIIECLICYVIGVCFISKDFWIDSDFSEDVEELEFRLEE